MTPPPLNSDPFSEAVVVWRSDAGKFAPSRISNLSRTGGFIETSQPPPVGTLVTLHLNAPGQKVSVQAMVRRSLPGRGMGIEFESLTQDDWARLATMVSKEELAMMSRSGPAATAAARPRNSRIERRDRFRHKLAAAVHATEIKSGRRAQGQLTVLGRTGCHVSFENPFPTGALLEIAITHEGQVFHAQARVASTQTGKGMGLAFTVVEPQEYSILDEWLAASLERAWLASNRRRSQRILVDIPVCVVGKNTAEHEICEQTKTVSVSAHGALLRLEMEVSKGQIIVLRNPFTDTALECYVDYVGALQNGRREVGVSFVLPNRTLWQVSFPPSDWAPLDSAGDDLDAKDPITKDANPRPDPRANLRSSSRER